MVDASFAGNDYQKWLAKLSITNMSNQTTLNALAWRRLYLARAKLKASSRTSALLSGFALVAMVEVDITGPQVTQIPGGWLIAFSVCTTLVVAVHLLALMVSTCILPNVEAVSNVHSLAAVHESPHERLHCYIEMAWILSTGVGIILFLVQMAILVWVRFGHVNRQASIVATALIVPAVVIFIAFAFHFYRQIIAHKYHQSARGLEELECMANELDNCNRPPQYNIHNV